MMQIFWTLIFHKLRLLKERKFLDGLENMGIIKLRK